MFLIFCEINCDLLLSLPNTPILARPHLECHISSYYNFAPYSPEETLKNTQCIFPYISFRPAISLVYNSLKHGRHTYRRYNSIKISLRETVDKDIVERYIGAKSSGELASSALG